jgi:transcriptional regulator with GAF, ATPase, and Fis domain
MLARTSAATNGSGDGAPWVPAPGNDGSHRGRVLRIPANLAGSNAPRLGEAGEPLDAHGIQRLLGDVVARLTATGDDAAEEGVVNDLRRVAEALQGTLDELRQLRESVREEGAQGGGPTVRLFGTSRLIVSESEAVRAALAQVEQVAPTPATVLLVGETGAGKEVFAQAIHELSQRHQRQMIRVSCAAIPSALIESELFGRERGAYTGAITRQMGRFEAANQSTLFLDEIGELSAEVQVKLLRVLQERVIERLGSTQSIKVDVRIIAATNRNLERAVEDKSFREDLFYRLNVFPIVVPPLRERLDDIPGLVWEFVNEFSKSLGKSISSISLESMRQLQLYPWPGNIRELRNVIERAVIMATGPRLTVQMPPGIARLPQTQTALTLKELEMEHIRTALRTSNWRVRGKGGAAERLGLKPTTLESRMAKLGVTRPRELPQ